MSNSTPTAKTTRRSCAGCATVLVAVAVFLVFRFHRMLEPADRVFVSLRNIDASTDYFFFVVDTPSGPEEMSWYLKKVTPFTMKPRGCTATHYDPGRGKEVTRAVQWTDGGRYGVVVGYEDGPERVFWFSPEEVHLRWNSWLRGGGQASIELPDKERGDDLGISGGKSRK